MSRKSQRMPFKDALDLVPDDMPDGAYWAMAHEIAGLDYGDGFDELAAEAGFGAADEGTEPPAGVTFAPLPKGAPFSRKPFRCQCGKRFRNTDAASQHRRDVHAAEAEAGDCEVTP